MRPARAGMVATGCSSSGSGSDDDGSSSASSASTGSSSSDDEGGGSAGPVWAGRISQRLGQVGGWLQQGRWAEAVAGYLSAVRALAPHCQPPLGGGGRTRSGAAPPAVDAPALGQLAADGLCMAVSRLAADLPEVGRRLEVHQQALRLLPAVGASAAAAGLHRQIGSEYAAAGRFDQAITSLRRSGELARVTGGAAAAAAAEESLQHVLGVAVPRWHFRMLNDSRRNRAYAAAIERAVVRGCRTVVDIGAGTGLLAMLAARAGATSVWAVECSPLMAALAREAVQANQRPEITVLEAMSTSLTVGPERFSEAERFSDTAHRTIPAKVDLVVSEILDAGLLGEHVLPTLRHAASALLKPGGVMIPSGARLHVALVESAALRDRHYLGDAALRRIKSAAAAAAAAADRAPAVAGGGAAYPDGSAAALDAQWCAAAFDGALGLDDGESYDTAWLHRLGDCRRRRDCHSAAPPYTFIRCSNTDKKGVPAE